MRCIDDNLVSLVQMSNAWTSAIDLGHPVALFLAFCASFNTAPIIH